MDNGTEPSLPLDIPEHSEVISGQKVGYARVSSKDQNLERQTAALKKEKWGVMILVDGETHNRQGLRVCQRLIHHSSSSNALMQC
ncbi:recombinase family protein [Corynebacterium casei]|uniref:recombinase family protein n=1 Tax=Corynebacterium casei TaxID=160386 RepID=UPI003FD5D9C8